MSTTQIVGYKPPPGSSERTKVVRLKVISYTLHHHELFIVVVLTIVFLCTVWGWDTTIVLAAKMFFCHLSLNYTFLKHLRPYYFFQKITLTFWHSTKKVFSANVSEMYNSARNGKQKFGGFGICGGFAAVSSQFLNKHHKSKCHTKAHCCN